MNSESETIDLDTASLFDPQTQSNPFPLYQALQEKCPVFQPKDGSSMYVVTRHEDLLNILRNPELFSNAIEVTDLFSDENGPLYQSILRDRGWEHVPVLQRTDPPQHRRYRRLVDKVFTPARVKALAPRIDELAVELVEGFADRGEVEIIREFANPLPGTIVAEQIGLDVSQISTFKKWSEVLTASLRGKSEAEVRAMAEIELEMQHYLAREYDIRKREPRDDLLSTLILAENNEEAPLSMHEFQNLMHQLIAGGYESAASAISIAVWRLVREPELVPLLRENRDKLRGFIEESLRIEAPTQGFVRRAMRDTEVAGVHIPKGTFLSTRNGAANRDPAQFECPHQFDIERKNTSHLTFGAGPHFCPGAALARQDITSALNALLDRIENLELSEPLPDLPCKAEPFFYSLKTLPIKFTRVK